MLGVDIVCTCVSLSPPKSSTQTASRSLQPFLQCLLGDRPTDRPTDHANQSVTIGGEHRAQLSMATTSIYWSSTDQIKFSNQQLYSAVRLDGCIVLNTIQYSPRIGPLYAAELGALFFDDQYAFRPTGSTTAALVATLLTVSNMLSSNQCARVFALDFSKAFDTVHSITRSWRSYLYSAYLTISTTGFITG